MDPTQVSSACPYGQRWICSSCLAPWAHPGAGSATRLLAWHSPSVGTVQICPAGMRVALSAHFFLPALPLPRAPAPQLPGTHHHPSPSPIGLHSAFPEGKRRSFVAVPSPDSPWSQRLIPEKSLARTHGTVVTVKMEGVSIGKTEKK